MHSAVTDLNGLIERTSCRPAKGIVVAPQPLAAQIGADILRSGGNAIDAAVGTALAQGVVDPFMCGIGGFGCLVLHSAERREDLAIGFHGRAGSLASPDVFADDVVGQIHGHGERYEVRGGVNQIGYRSVVVPGTPAGLEAAHRRFGRLPWHVLFEPAIALARQGLALPGEVHDRWVEIPEPGHRSGWERINATKACAEIFAPGGKLLTPGAPLRQTAYANTLERLARAGTKDFYHGELAQTIAEDFARNNGLLTAEDLSAYHVDEGEPVCGGYRGIAIRSVPLPASGVQLVQMLKVLEHVDLGRLRSSDQALYVHIVARAMLAGFRDRALHMGDPRFIKAPVEWLCSDEHAREQAELVCGEQPIEVPGLAYRETPYTTNVCVADSEGNAIALTHTLGSASGVVIPSLGFIFNNCMYQFNPLRGTPNSIAPGKSRLSGICPTILLRDQQPWAIMGGLGGTRILTSVLHMILNLVDHRMSPVEAVDAARFHAEAPWLEMETRLSHALGGSLQQRGWRVRPSSRGYDRSFAITQLAVVGRGVCFSGGSDPRGGGGLAIA